MDNDNQNKQKGIFVGLIILQFITSLGAIPAGISLISDPSGGGLTWTLDMLGNAPFPNYLIPGIVLLAVIGIGHLIGGVLSILRHRFAGPMAIGLGIFLVGWIVAQVWWLGLNFWLQPLFFFVGIVEATLGHIVFGRFRANG